MAEEPPVPGAPRPVIPIDEPAPQPPTQVIPIEPVPAIPVSEPGVVAPAPFAQVYRPPPTPSAPPAMTAPPPPASYYPPPYRQGWPQAPDYRSAGFGAYTRPGIISTMAIGGIIVAAMSLIASLISGCTGLMVMGSAKRAATVARMTAVPSMVATPSASNMTSTVNGLNDVDRAVVIQALRAQMRHPLTAERHQQMDAFLAEHGGLVLDSSRGLTVKSVRQQIGQTGQQYSNPGTSGPEFFVFKPGGICTLPGRLSVYDDRAVFDPADHSEKLRSSVKPQDGSVAVQQYQPPPPALEDEEVRALVSRAKSLSDGRMNLAQTAALTTLLESSNHAAYVEHSSTISGLTAQVRSVVMQSDGTATIAFTMNQLTLDRNGQAIGQLPLVAPVTPPLPSAPAPGSPTTGPAFVMGAMGVDYASCSMIIIVSILSALIAILLLVVGIMSLRQSPIGRRGWILYAALKIPCAVLALIAFTWMIDSMNVGNDPMGIARGMSESMKGIAGTERVLAGFGLLFPLFVLVTILLSKSARDYYKPTT